MSKSQDYEKLKSLLENSGDTSLVMYRLPNEKTINLLIGKAENFAEADAFSSPNGFLFSPAINSKQHQPYLISITNQWQLNDASQLDLNWYQWPISTIEPTITAQHDYLNQALGMVWAMRDNQLKKAILSRILRYPKTNFNPYNTFTKLCEKYAGVMVYLVAIPTVGTWMGATPETLLQIDNGQANTMALAGTQKDTGLPLSEVTWGAKELEEQQIVTDNIEQLISIHFPNAKVQVDGPQTVSTGALLHLNTHFQWNVDADNEAIAGFVADLHPTPAIVGAPRESALELISQTEKHDRAYYTGLLGPIAHKGFTHLFVNLRCMQVFDSYVALYLGGGLTANSDPEAEWNETELKAQTLLQVLA